MISEVEFYGGSRAEAPSADVTIGEDDVRVIVYSPSVNVGAFLPPFSTQALFTGGPRFYILNDSQFVVSVRRSDGSILQIIGAKGAGDPNGVMLHVGETDWVRRLFNTAAGVTS